MMKIVQKPYLDYRSILVHNLFTVQHATTSSDSREAVVFKTQTHYCITISRLPLDTGSESFLNAQRSTTSSDSREAVVFKAQTYYCITISRLPLDTGSESFSNAQRSTTSSDSREAVVFKA
jgi:TPP-dependent trihydroxycyclohexane-1,2-dione (THcHDO) dehydratase